MDGREQYRVALEELLTHHGVDAQSRVAAVDGAVGSMHYLDTGETGCDRPPVVCLHGAGTPGTDWVPLLAELEDRRMIVPERPGHGLTPPTSYSGEDFRAVNHSLLVALLDSLGVDSASIVGNSFGGYHALALAASSPDRVERLVLAGAPAGIERTPPLVTRLFGVPGVNRLWYRVSLPDDVDDARTVYQRINVEDASRLSTAFFESYLASTRVPGRRRTLLSQFEGIVGFRGFSRSFLIREECSSIKVPTRFVWGDADYFSRQTVGQQVAAEMPDAEFLGVDSAGHMPWLEPGRKGREAIVEFL